MIQSRITSKAQTTIPRPVRAALGLREGDTIAYEIDGDRVVISKASIDTWFDPFACFDEWNSDADREGYANL